MILRKGYTLKGYKMREDGTKSLIVSLYRIDDELSYDVSLSGNMYAIKFRGDLDYALMLVFVDTYSIFNVDGDLIEDYKTLS